MLRIDKTRESDLQVFTIINKLLHFYTVDNPRSSYQILINQIKFIKCNRFNFIVVCFLN